MKKILNAVILLGLLALVVALILKDPGEPEEITINIYMVALENSGTSSRQSLEKPGGNPTRRIGCNDILVPLSKKEKMRIEITDLKTAATFAEQDIKDKEVS